jgi:hypothetical protein
LRKRTTNIRGRGGARPGAGRPKRKANKFDAEVRAKAAEEGILPVEYMLRVMRDKRHSTQRRDAMAVAAAPYLHHKLSSVELKNKPGEKLRMVMEGMSEKEAAEAYATALAQPTNYDEDETRH